MVRSQSRSPSSRYGRLSVRHRSSRSRSHDRRRRDANYTRRDDRFSRERLRRDRIQEAIINSSKRSKGDIDLRLTCERYDDSYHAEYDNKKVDAGELNKSHKKHRSERKEKKKKKHKREKYFFIFKGIFFCLEMIKNLKQKNQKGKTP